MSKTYFLLIFCLLLQPAMADTTDGVFWEKCPGSACPANVPNRDTNVYQRDYEQYKQMDNKKLKQKRELHEKAIKEIQREEKQRYGR